MSDPQPDELVAECTAEKAHIFARNNLRNVRVGERSGVLQFDGTTISLSEGESNQVKVSFPSSPYYENADEECQREIDKLRFRMP